MLGLSLFGGKTETKPSKEQLLQAARGIWLFSPHHNWLELQAYLEIEISSTLIRSAVIEFLSANTTLDDFASEIEVSKDFVRSIFKKTDYDCALLQNILAWGVANRKPSARPGCELRLCATRMLAIVKTFRAEISQEAIEVATTSFLQMLGSSEVRNVSDLTWVDCLTQVQVLASKRQNGPLTREELTRLRDSVVLIRPHAALTLQHMISALS